MSATLPRVGLFARVRKLWWRIQHSRVLRRRLLFRGATMLTVGVLIATCLVTLHNARVMQQSWGETRPVYRFTRNLDAGELITPDTIELIEVPVIMVPPTAIEELVLPQRVISHVTSGEILTMARLSHGDDDSLTQLVPYGHSMVAISFSAPHMAINPGDVVSLFDTSRAATGIWGSPVEPMVPTQVDDDLVEPVPQTESSKLAELIAESLVIVHVDQDQSQLIVSVPDSELAVVTGVVASGQFMVVPHGAARPHCRDDSNC